MIQPNVEDFYQLDSLLTSEEKMIRDAVRNFMTQEALPIIAEAFEKGRFPKELIPGLAGLGIFGPTIQGYGCAGISETAYGLIMQEIERVDSGLRSFVSVQGGLAMHAISEFGTEEQKQKYLPEMAQGKLIGCFGLTEPDFGSNPAGMLTTARKDGSDYILNGNKMWITNGTISDLAIVWAKNEDKKVVGFIVEKGTPGYRTKDIEHKFSLRASVTSEIILENARVPAKNKLDIVGFKGPFGCLNKARFGIAWGVIGAAQACFTEALSYSKNRIQFNKPIAQFQLVQRKLVNMWTEITKAQLLAYHLARSLENDTAVIQQISMAKMNNVAMALHTARECRDILGANGITYEYHTARHLLNLESVITYEGTDDIHRLILGEHLTGLPAYA